MSTCDDLIYSKQKLQDQIYLLVSRDIDIEIEKHEKSVLNNKVVEQAKEIERLQVRIKELSSELHKLKQKPASKNKGIISINNKNQ